MNLSIKVIKIQQQNATDATVDSDVLQRGKMKKFVWDTSAIINIKEPNKDGC